MTNQLIISNTSIRKDSVGRYSLNDLHIASGSQQKHKPVHWLSNQQTNDLIEEIIKVENPTFEPVHIKKGRYGGTYVCKELVYSYAMWISAAFALKVIRAYDDLVSGRVEQAIRLSTVQERNPLKDAVNLLVSKKGIMYPEAYAFVHQRFNISSIEELTTNQIPEAVEYIHKIVLEGEYIPKQQLPQTGLESLAMPMSFFDEYDWLFELEGVDKKESLSEFYRYPQKMLKNMAEYPNPLIEMLTKLRSMGVNIDAAYFWLKALQHHYEVNTSSLNRKERQLSDILLNNTSVAHNIIKSIIDEWRNTLAPAIKKLNPNLESEVSKQLSELNGVVYCNLLTLKGKPEAKLLA